MKPKLTFYLLVFLFFSSPKIFAQKNTDVFLRAALASEFIEEAGFNYDSPKGEACANILLKTFRACEELPALSMSNINDHDKQQIEKLKSKLIVLRKNPPSWDEITNQEARHLQDADKAIRKKSKYKE